MRNRTNIALALLLIGLGAWFLAVQLVPELHAFAYGRETWPLQITGIGAFLFLLGLVTWLPGFFVPASIVAGVGGLLYYQNLTGDWRSWAYAWALIPGFAGLGTVLLGLSIRSRRTVAGGLWTIFNSIVLFAIFGSFLGGRSLIFRFWPVLLIAFGLLLLVQGPLRGGSRRGVRGEST